MPQPCQPSPSLLPWFKGGLLALLLSLAGLPCQAAGPAASEHGLALWLSALLAAILATNLIWMTRLSRLNRRLRLLAETDALTGLPNRNALNPSFSLDILRAQRYDRPLSVILLDIDHFKDVNDDFGHLTGDRVLEAFAHLIQDGLREVDTVCRWGGEEFLVICHETDLEQARRLAERTLERVREHVFPCPRPLTVSAGVATLMRCDTTATLMQRADESLYDAKGHGRDRVGIKLLECPCAD